MEKKTRAKRPRNGEREGEWERGKSEHGRERVTKVGGEGTRLKEHNSPITLADHWHLGVDQLGWY